MRATMSATPPGAKGTIMRIGREGYVCAETEADVRIKAAATNDTRAKCMRIF
jgi:hypothetical protein